MARQIPLARPEIRPEDQAAVQQVLETNLLSRGPALVRFEQAMADRCQVRHAVGVSSGTAALEIILKGLDIKAGDEVITPSFTVPATANAILNAGAVPVMVDIEPENLGLAPGFVSRAITPATRAIIVVHAFGMTACLDQLVPLAKRHNLHLVEDACEALGTTWQERPLGSFGIAGAFGFYPNKQVTCGEGGMIVTDDEDLAQNCRALRNNGRAMSGQWLDQLTIGQNARLPEMAAALGTSQLSRLDDIVRRRRSLAQSYLTQLQRIDGVRSRIQRPVAEKTSWFALHIQLSDAFDSQSRDRLAVALSESGVQTGRYFAPLHLQPAFRTHVPQTRSFTVTDSVASRSLTLPFFHQLTDADITFVCDKLAAAIAGHQEELSRSASV